MKTKLIIALFLLMLCGQLLFAQSTEIRPGIVLPQMTSTQRTALSATNGMLVFDTDTQSYWFRQNGAWVNLAAAGGGWTTNVDHIYNSNSENVGIGTNNPTQKLEVKSGVFNKSGVKITNLVGEISTGTSTKLFVNLNKATGLAFDNSGNLYVTNFSEHKIHKVTPAGVISDFVTTNINYPFDILFGPDGNLYVSNYQEATVVKITLAGVVSYVGSGYNAPTGLAFDNSNNLYVVNRGSGAISKVNAAGIVVSHTFATGLTDPTYCIYDVSTNKLFISDYREIAQVNISTGGAKTTFKAGLSRCQGIAIDNVGNLYVAQTYNKISKITPSGDESFYGSTDNPFDIAFDASGILYTANQSTNGVLKLSQTFNTLLAVNQTGEVTTTNLSFNKGGYKLYVDENTGGAISGVFSETKSGSALYGKSSGGVGVAGTSTSNIGVAGTSDTGTGLRGKSLYGRGIEGFSNNDIGVYGEGGTYAGLFNGNVTVSGIFCAPTVACPSDIRLKKDFSPLESSLSKLSNLKGYHYYWKDSTHSKNLQTGVIAQELQKIFPELTNQDKDGFLSVNYIGLIPHLVEAVKELRVMNKELESKNEFLMTELKKLITKGQQLDTRLDTVLKSDGRNTQTGK